MDLDALAAAGDEVAGRAPRAGGRVVCHVTIEPETLAYQRPRFNAASKGVFHSAEQKAELERVGMYLLTARKGSTPTTLPVRVTIGFYRSTRRKVDIDNLTKLVLDAGNGVLWFDDSQVVELHVRKVLGVGKKALTVVLVVEV